MANTRPTNLDEAPEFLTVTEVASALGCDRRQVRALEAGDPSFPRRQALPFGKLERFSRRALIDWVNANRGDAA